MAAETVRDPHDLRKLLAAATAVGAVHQHGDGRATYLQGLSAAAVNDDRRMQPVNQVRVPKTTGIVILDGGRVYFDRSAGTATYRTLNDRDFYLGTAVGDAASADDSLVVNMNQEPYYEIELSGNSRLSQGAWVCEKTNGLGVTLLPGGGAQLAFHAAAQAAQAALYSERKVDLASNPILEMRVALFDKGDNAALDINFGLANGSHATDFQSVTEQVTFHLNGNALDLFAESDDGTIDVAEVDTTFNCVDDEWFECWIDCRDLTDIQMYVNGVLRLGSNVFTLEDATGPVFPIFHMEKTSDDTVADFRIDLARLRTAEQ